MKSSNSNGNYDWIYTTKFKITFEVSRVQNLNNLKGILGFSEHSIILKVPSFQNDEKKKINYFEIIKNLFNPIFNDDENNIYFNYCLIEQFVSSNGLIQIFVYNPVNKRNYTINITSLEKSSILFSSSLKVDEINKLTRFLNNKITYEIKFIIEEFLLMINTFKEILEKNTFKNILCEEKISKSMQDAKKYYEKQIKELKKQNQMKNEMNKKILKEKITNNKIDKTSINLLSHIETETFLAFDAISADLKLRGFNLVEENINLFFEITSLENNILNLKKVDKTKVSSNLQNLNNINKDNQNKISRENKMNNNSGNNYYNSNKNHNSLMTHNPISKYDNKKYSSYHGNKNEDSARFTQKGEQNSNMSNNNTLINRSSSHVKLPQNSPITEKIVKTRDLSANIIVKDKLNKGKFNKANANIGKNNTIENTDTNRYNNSRNFHIKTIKNINSDTISDVNGIFDENLNNHSNHNCDKNYNYNLKIDDCLFNKNFLDSTPIDNYYFESEFYMNNKIDSVKKKNSKNINVYAEDSEYVSSSTKTNSKKDEFDQNNGNQIKYLNNIKDLKEVNSDISMETPKFFKQNLNNKKNKANNLENIYYNLLTKRINIIKENHLFTVNNDSNNIFNNSAELFCRKYFEYSFEEYFPKFFNIEKDLNGILKVDSFYSYFFYLRGLKNHLFTDENKIQFSNVFFFD